MQEAKSFGPPQAGEVRDVTAPHKRSLAPSTDGLHPVLKYVQRLLFLK